MIEIVTKTNSFVLNGIQYAKNDLTVQPTTTGVKIGHFVAKLDEVTIDGATFSNREDLMDALDSSIFKKGGGDGDGVTQQELDQRVPVLTEGNFLVGGANGNDGRKITPSDIGYTSGGGLRIVSILNGELTTPFPASSSVLNSSAVVRTGGGQGKFSPSSAVDEAIVQSQFSCIENNTLTNSETSATLNSAYPSVVVGTIVTSETGLVEYRKISPTTWSKKVIEIV